MAAVTGGLYEAQRVKLDPSDEGVEEQATRVSGLGSFAGLGGALKQLPTVPQSHASLTRTVWVRRVLEQWASQQRFTVARGEGGANAGQLVLKLSGAPMPKNVVPWMTAVSDYQEFSLWGESGKMNCPTWDLPAGGLYVGGTCPGADAGQTVIDPAKRRASLVADGSGRFFLRQTPPGVSAPPEMKEGGTICSQCYAFEGNYPSPHVQLGEVLRYWWVRSMLEQGRASELVDTLVLSMKLIRYPETPYGILPVRIHSAGDFFSKDYAKVWCDVADELWRMGGNAARVRMWAPTRTWAQWGNGFWAEQLGSLASVRDGQAPNLMVRASAYNFNDAAPGAFHPTNAAGSTSLMQSQEEPRLARNAAAGIPTSSGEAFRPVPGEARYDWACPTYSIEQDKHTCSNATNPEGGVHCRACWVRPEWRVQYTAH